MANLNPRKAQALLATLALLLAIAGGCKNGYTFRPPFDPCIKTVYVPIARSFSFRNDINTRFTLSLQQEIEKRTPYKVVGSPDGADAILEAVITNVDKQIWLESPNNLPRQLNGLITAEVKFYDNRPGSPPPPLTPVIVSETVSFFPELGETTSLAYQKVIDKMVMQVVGMMETPWASRDDEPMLTPEEKKEELEKARP